LKPTWNSRSNFRGFKPNLLRDLNGPVGALLESGVNIVAFKGMEIPGAIKISERLSSII
jgi:hypothetical protein